MLQNRLATNINYMTIHAAFGNVLVTRYVANTLIYIITQNILHTCTAEQKGSEGLLPMHAWLCGSGDHAPPCMCMCTRPCSTIQGRS